MSTDLSTDTKLCVIGLGYIGLPTASMFATHGYQVLGVDIKRATVEAVNNGVAHIQEPGLKTLVEAAVKSGNLRASTTPQEADVFIIAVPTPATPDKRADLGAVISATETIAPYLRTGNLIVLESTVPPGTTTDIVVPLLERSGLRAGQDLFVAHAPERVLPGRILVELVQNDRVIGGIDSASAERAVSLYRSFVAGRIFLTHVTMAELVKLMENTYRDVNIALANELARISDQLGTSIWEAIELANRHPRVNILQPGPGVGGHCIAIDPWFIVEKAPTEAHLISMARQVNDGMPAYVSRLILDLVRSIPEPRVAVLGVTYKANVDDTRESPALHVAEMLSQAGCEVRLHDPYVYPQVTLDDVVIGTDCLALLVNHWEYADLDPASLALRMRNRRLFTAKNLVPYEPWLEAGFRVKRLGDGQIPATNAENNNYENLD
jgi:UDP-N-acetyl-D-mannosaminuronic acid dehydrogenase